MVFLFNGKRGRYNDLFLSCSTLFDYFKINYSRSRLNELLELHNDYPSLLAIKDVLWEYRVESSAIRKNDYCYSDFEAPFICSIQKEHWSKESFVVVTDAYEGLLTYINPENDRPETIYIEEFNKIDKGIILLVNGENATNEIGYEANKRQEIVNNIVNLLPFIVLTGLLLIAGINLLSIDNRLIIALSFGYLFSGIAGVLISFMLVMHEMDSYNPFIREVCGMFGKQSSCQTVLSSSTSSFLGVSWSIWGFAYFTSLLISTIFFSGSISNIINWSIVSILISPYILFSIYYQWKVVKAWCPLCLLIQMLILINLTLGITALYFSSFRGFDIHQLLISFIMGIGILSIISMIIPAFKDAKKTKEYLMRWRKLHYKSEVFNALLRDRQPAIYYDDLGILLGDVEAPNEIVKVCNPYCGPCSQAHPELDAILKNNLNVKVRVIFTATGQNDDYRTAPVRHLLAVEEKYGKEEVHEALSDWYSSGKKDYGSFALKYPVNGSLDLQDAKILKMREWCDNMKIRVTPTFFVNGHEMPENYSIKDLKNFL